jgi:hypothetical protein
MMWGYRGLRPIYDDWEKRHVAQQKQERIERLRARYQRCLSDMELLGVNHAEQVCAAEAEKM